MPEPNPGTELGQPRLHRRHRRLYRDAQPSGRPPYQRPVPGRIGRRQLQQPPGLLRQRIQLSAIFVEGLGLTVSGGTFVPIPDHPVTAGNYQHNIAAVLGVSAGQGRGDRG